MDPEIPELEPRNLTLDYLDADKVALALCRILKTAFRSHNIIRRLLSLSLSLSLSSSLAPPPLSTKF